MSEPQHTQLPWVAKRMPLSGRWIVLNRDTFQICEMDCNVHMPEGMPEANARFIAANSEINADLLAACKPFSHDDLCRQFGGSFSGTESIVFVRDRAVLRIRDFHNARAAIAKAEKTP